MMVKRVSRNRSVACGRTVRALVRSSAAAAVVLAWGCSDSGQTAGSAYQGQGSAASACVVGEPCACAGVSQGSTVCPGGPDGVSSCQCGMSPAAMMPMGNAPPAQGASTGQMAPQPAPGPQAPTAGMGGGMGAAGPTPIPGDMTPAPSQDPMPAPAPMRPPWFMPPQQDPEPMDPEPMDPEPEPTDPPPNPNDDLDALRQFCVDHINMHRASLGLSPLARATPEQDACSDAGAKKDGDSGVGHASAGDCRRLGLPGAQNTCPGWPVGGFGGGTLQSALERCLDQMWAEGEPPGGIQACIADRTGCFLEHGHYINMVGDHGIVSCGFYEMPDGRWWMNQNFGP